MVLGSGSRMVQIEHYGIREWFSNHSNGTLWYYRNTFELVGEWFSNGSNGTLWY